MARQWAIVKLNRHGFMATVLSSQNAMSLCHAVINLLSLTKDKEGKNSHSKAAQRRERYFLMHNLIFISCLSVLGRARARKQLRLLEACIGATT